MENTKELEQWKTIEDYPLYEVSNMGRVRSNNNPKNPKILRFGTTKGGYKQVVLTKEKGSGWSKSFAVHKLVAKAWVENPDGKPHIDHISTIKTDNRASNLRWVTPKENAHNEITYQRIAEKNRQREEKRRKQVYQYDKDLNLIAIHESTLQAAKTLGISQGNIVLNCNRTLLSTNGFIFSYEPLTEPPKLDEEKRKRFMEATSRASKKWQKNNYESNRKKALDGYYKRMYGMTREEYFNEKGISSPIDSVSPSSLDGCPQKQK